VDWIRGMVSMIIECRIASVVLQAVEGLLYSRLVLPLLCEENGFESTEDEKPG
jgi:hypothetical protein